MRYLILFAGGSLFEMPRETNTLPTTRLLGGRDATERILEAGVPDLSNGFGKDVFCFGEMCAELFKEYPKIGKYVQIYHPDTQGTLDTAELLWGMDMFYDMYDDPEFVHELFRLISDTHIRFLDKWFAINPASEGLNVHWRLMHRGKIVLRNDSAMNLSPDMYREFALPYDTRLLDYYGGGCVHFCGRGDHYIDILTGIKSLTGINMSQPHLNDMDKIYRAVHANGKKIVGLKAIAGEAYAQRPDAVRGMIF